MKKRLFSGFRAAVLALAAALMVLPAFAAAKSVQVSAAEYPVERSGWYSTMEEVAVYLHTYGELPGNFLTKNEAERLGWDNRKGNLDEVAPGCSIGGNRFGNYEGALPDAKGRKWTECDINYTGGYRGGERIVFSNDGLIYYSRDHYNNFVLIEVVEDAPAAPQASSGVKVEKNGQYTSRDEVAAYLHAYGVLPSNYLTRSEAKALGWTNKKDNLGKVAPGCAIGGGGFQNREKQLPQAKGRSWYECDVNTKNGKRGKERVVYSNDGLIYYTPDNHKTFTKLY